jgi:hypothetical protein
MFDYKAIKVDLLKLYEAASVVGGRRDSQIEQFISVGEYSLALDGIADTYLAKNIPIANDLFKIFEELAIAMDLEDDQEFREVGRLIKAQAHSTTD